MRFLPRPLAVLLLLALTPPLRGATNAITTLPELRDALSNHLAAPRFEAALWGVKILSLASGNTVFEQNPRKLFSPASNAKLFTVAMALDRFGVDQRTRTSLYGTARPDGRGVLDGELILFGRCDPGFRAELHSNDLFRSLQPLVAALTNAGVRRIKGGLVADESFLAGPPYGSGWDWDDFQYYYGARLSALTVNNNCTTLTARPGAHVGEPVRLSLAPPAAGLHLTNQAVTGPTNGANTFRLERLPGEAAVRALGQLPLGARPVTEDVPVPDPARWFGALFKEALARNGVPVDGEVRVVNWLDRRLSPLDTHSLIELAAVESAPLSQRAAWILKPSQNLFTDLLLGEVGAQWLGTNTVGPWETSEAAGIRALKEFLPRAGIAPNGVIFEEGSGLSRDNVVTPEAIVSLLAFMDRHPAAAVWREALPLAGVDGTLRRRMKDTPAEGNVRAKTGTLRWANSLSGYVTTAAGERLAFSIMLNRYRNADPARATREEIDFIPEALARFTGRSQ